MSAGGGCVAAGVDDDLGVCFRVAEGGEGGVDAVESDCAGDR